MSSNWGPVAVLSAMRAGALPPTLGALERVVLVVMADFQGESGEAWPSMESLAKACGCSTNAARAAVQRLVSHGVLARGDRAALARRLGRKPQETPVPYVVEVHPVEVHPVEVQTMDLHRVSAAPPGDGPPGTPGDGPDPLTDPLRDPPIERARERAASTSRPSGVAKAKTEPKRKSSAPPADDAAALAAWLARWDIPSPESDRVVAHFLDHHRAKGSTFLDWAAAWRTWRAREADFGGRTRGPIRQQGAACEWPVTVLGDDDQGAAPPMYPRRLPKRQQGAAYTVPVLGGGTWD